MSEIKEKIKKLLALAASDNEAEAELAMQYAQTLMDKHRISMMDLADIEESIIRDKEPLLEAGRIPGWKSQLCMVLCEYNNCRIVKYTGQSNERSTQLIIFGKPSNIDLVRYLLAYNIIQLTKYANFACMGEGHKYKDSWYNGAVQGIRSKMYEGRKQALENIPQNSLIKFNSEMQSVNSFIEDNLGKLRKGQASQSRMNNDAYNKGHTVGKSLDSSGRQNKTIGMR